MGKEARSAAIVAAVFAVISALAFYFIYQQQQKRDKLSADLTAIATEIQGLEDKVKRLGDLQAKLDSIEANLASYITILPSPQVATEEGILRLVQSKGEKSDFASDAVSIRGAKANAPKGGKGNPFREISVTLQGIAEWDEFLGFLNELERDPTFLRVNSFSCSAPSEPEVDEETGRERWLLTINLNVSTFRYDPAQ